MIFNVSICLLTSDCWRLDCFLLAEILRQVFTWRSTFFINLDFVYGFLLELSEMPTNKCSVSRASLGLHFSILHLYYHVLLLHSDELRVESWPLLFMLFKKFQQLSAILPPFYKGEYFIHSFVLSVFSLMLVKLFCDVIFNHYN